MLDMNVTQVMSNSFQAQKPAASVPPQFQRSESEEECWSICRDRFKFVILISVAMQYLLLMIYSIVVNINFLHPVTWFKESFWILCSPLMLLVVVHGYCTLKPFMKVKLYQPTRLSKFVQNFSHESTVFILNFFIGLFTSLLFIRHLNEDFQTFSFKSEDKKFLNEKFAFLLLNGAFVRCYFYVRQASPQSIAFQMVHQSKFSQLRRDICNVLKSSFVVSLLPAVHFLGFYLVFGGSFCYFLRRVCGFNFEATSIMANFAIAANVKLLVYSWILSSLVWSSMELTNKLIVIFAAEPKQFPIQCNNSLILSEALSMGKFQIVQQLAAQDLYLLADNPNGLRRKQFYALSNPGGHPHNWKLLVVNLIEIIESFSDELKKAFEVLSKNPTNNNSAQLNLNQPFHQFYENKRLAREFNDFNGVRSLSTAEPVKVEPLAVRKYSNLVTNVHQKILSNRFVFFFIGETDDAKLNFLLKQNSQTITWITQGVAAIIARSIREDSFGVVQHDIKQILKSLIKLKAVLDKVGVVNTIAKDRNFLAMKAAVRRSLYRIVAVFSNHFEDLLLDPEDIRALHGFVTFKEL